MAHRVYTINSAEDWGKCAEWLAEYAKGLPDKMYESVHEIAQVGAKEAQSVYSSNVGDETAWIASATSTSVITKKIGEYTDHVVASGKEVPFNEFGAGASADSQHPYASLMNFEVRPGSWSDTYGGKYSINIDNVHGHFWRFAKKRWAAIRPSRGMYNASQKMQSEAPKIIRKVFGRQ